MTIHRLYRPVSAHFRTRRMSLFAEHFRLSPQTRVLDVGGGPFNWRLLPVVQRPQVTFLNIRAPHGPVSDPWLVADGGHLPFATGAFDIVYSNSVIEHLGSWDSQQRFADECARVGHSYYVQTPNRRFPIEPHLIAPVIHWLPRGWQRRLMRHFTVWGWLTRPTPAGVEALLAEIRLLDEPEMRRLFPDATIWKERLAGLTKSLIALRVR